MPFIGWLSLIRTEDVRRNLQQCMCPQNSAKLYSASLRHPHLNCFESAISNQNWGGMSTRLTAGDDGDLEDVGLVSPTSSKAKEPKQHLTSPKGNKKPPFPYASHLLSPLHNSTCTQNKQKRTNKMVFRRPFRKMAHIILHSNGYRHFNIPNYVPSKRHRILHRCGNRRNRHFRLRI